MQPTMTLSLPSTNQPEVHLPVEVHAMIAVYLPRQDLPSYRLTSRKLAEASARELFHTITVHYSTSSFGRLASIASSNHLRSLVKTLVIDTNTYVIPDVSSFEAWGQIVDLKNPLPTWLRGDMIYIDLLNPSELHALRMQQMISHTGRKGRQVKSTIEKAIKDEELAKKSRGALSRIVSKLNNIQHVKVLNGELERDDRDVVRSGEILIAHDTLPRRGEFNYLHAINGVGIVSHPDNVALNTIVKLKNLNVSSLELNILSWHAFSKAISAPHGIKTLNKPRIVMTNKTEEIDFIGDTPTLIELGCLDLFPAKDLVYRDLKRLREQSNWRTLGKFISSFPHLEVLSLEVQERIERQTPKIFDELPPGRLDRIFESFSILPKLRSISLRHVESTPGFLISFLQQHGTLKNLSLHGVYLDSLLLIRLLGQHTDRGDPKSIESFGCAEFLQRLRQFTNLDQMSFSGTLTYQDERVAWNFDKYHRLRRAVETYLTNDDVEMPDMTKLQSRATDPNRKPNYYWF